MNVKTILLFFALISCSGLSAQEWGDWTSWGDTHDGYYRNPVLPADFSDIDCIEHDGIYYLISSTFQFQPGMIIMKSVDMVNWEVAGYAVSDIRQISPAMNYDVMDRYGRGIWAGAIRWHRGRFYVYFGTPDEGYFMTSAPRVEGPWDTLTKMSIGSGWDDPCPYIDDYGNGYLVATCYADNYKTYVFSLTRDLKDIIPDSRRMIHEGKGREANKLYKVDGWFYHLFSEVNDEGRQLMIQRSRVPSGPYEGVRPLSAVQRHFHEPNQGGFLYDHEGTCYFLTHHGTGDWSGRIVSLLPVTWNDGWPVIGQPNASGVGEMVWKNRKPATSKTVHLSGVQASHRQNLRSRYWEKRRQMARIVPYNDVWEWNYYPRTDKESVSYQGGSLSVRLDAFPPLRPDDLLSVGNILTTRSWRTSHSSMTVRLSLKRMADGQRAGICHFSSSWSAFGVEQQASERWLYCQTNHGQAQRLLCLKGHQARYIYLRSEWGLDGKSRYSYSGDGVHFHSLPVADYQLQWGNYRGDRLGLFTYNSQSERGSVDFVVVEQKK